MPRNTNETTDESEVERKPEPTETGYYVYRGDELLAGPYLTEDDAQAFVDGHAEGKGDVRFVEVAETNPE